MNAQQVLELCKPELKSIAEKIVLQVGFEAIEKVVADSANKVDDAFLAMFETQLKEAIKQGIEAL